MKEYDNYIFDLYGTLIDIHTDERRIAPWRFMADIYSVYGCDWDAVALRHTYFALDKAGRKKLYKETGLTPEIKIERVFTKLIFECGSTHPTVTKICGISMEEWRERYRKDPDAVIDELCGSDAVTAISNVLRIASRRYIKPYENTISTLKKLRESGKGVYLLSNAQRVYTYPEIEKCIPVELFNEMYISSDHSVMKPEPEFMDRLIKAFGLDKERSVMVGNEMKCDVAVASRAEMDCIFLNTGSLTEEELDIQLKEWCGEEGYPKGHTLTMVMSGDIAEILNYR